MDGTVLDSRSRKWIKQGRGSGTGKDYQPWLTVRDLPSLGRSHRIWGSRTKRIHHLLSDLELAAFYLFDSNVAVVDIKEQFPLRLDDTIKLAENASIKHPEIRGHIQVMSTDFLVEVNQQESSRFAIQVKTTSDLSKPRTIEKLELERRYWKSKEIPWSLFTEWQIPKTVIDNLEWLYPRQGQVEITDELIDFAQNYQNLFQQHPNKGISDVAMILDQFYSIDSGDSLGMIRTLMACRFILFDIRVPWSDLTVAALDSPVDISFMRDRYAANQ